MDYKRKHTHANSGTGNYFLIYGPWKPISTRAISVLKQQRKMAQIPATYIKSTWSQQLKIENGSISRAMAPHTEVFRINK